MGKTCELCNHSKYSRCRAIFISVTIQLLFSALIRPAEPAQNRIEDGTPGSASFLTLGLAAFFVDLVEFSP